MITPEFERHMEEMQQQTYLLGEQVKLQRSIDRSLRWLAGLMVLFAIVFVLSAIVSASA
jgi:hypothetical protein